MTVHTHFTAPLTLESAPQMQFCGMVVNAATSKGPPAARCTVALTGMMLVGWASTLSAEAVRFMAGCTETVKVVFLVTDRSGARHGRCGGVVDGWAKIGVFWYGGGRERSLQKHLRLLFGATSLHS